MDKAPTPPMPDTSGSAPSPGQPKPQVDVQVFRGFVSEYGRTLAIALLVAAVVIVGLTWYRGQNRAAEEKAFEMLNMASDVRQLEEIRSRYSSTLAGQMAALGLGKVHYDNGNYSAAITCYSDFEKKHPDHAMVGIATVGKLHCLEATGQSEEALAGYTAFASNHPTHFLVADATIGKARVLEQMGRLKEAKIIYEDFIASHPKSPRLHQVEASLTQVQQKLGSGKSDR